MSMSVDFVDGLHAQVATLLVDPGVPEHERMKMATKAMDDCPAILAFKPSSASLLSLAITKFECSTTQEQLQASAKIIEHMVKARLEGHEVDLNDGCGNKASLESSSPLYRFLFVKGAQSLIALFIRAGANFQVLENHLVLQESRYVGSSHSFLSACVIPENLSCARQAVQERKATIHGFVQELMSPAVIGDEVVSYL